MDPKEKLTFRLKLRKKAACPGKDPEPAALNENLNENQPQKKHIKTDEELRQLWQDASARFDDAIR